MEKKEIQKYIEESVKIFRECLEKTYLKEKTPFYGVGYHTLMNFFIGKISYTRKTNGNFRICGELPKVMLKEKVKGLPRKFDDWRIFPLVFTLFHVKPDNQKRIAETPTKKK